MPVAKINTMRFPGGKSKALTLSYDENVLAMLKTAGIIYARTVNSTGNFQIPQNFLTWDPTCHHNDPELMDLAKKFCEEISLFGQPQLFYLWGHSYEFDMDNNWQVMENFLKYMSDYQNEIWMATNGEIVDYVSAYRNLVFSADGKRIYNPSAVVLWMESLGCIYKIGSGETITIK